jgi:hypothetical protein
MEKGGMRCQLRKFEAYHDDNNNLVAVLVQRVSSGSVSLVWAGVLSIHLAFVYIPISCYSIHSQYIYFRIQCPRISSRLKV